MTAVLISVAILVAAYIGWEWARITDEPDVEAPPLSINEMVDLHSDLANLGPFDQEAWR